MKARALFTIVLKIIGLLFISSIIQSVISLVWAIFYWERAGQESYAVQLIAALLPLILYSLAAYIFIFRADKIVDRMKLYEDLGIDIIPFSMHRSTVLSIALIVIGGLVLVDQIPNLIRHLYVYYQKSQLQYTETDASQIVFSITKIIIGLLIIGNQRKLVSLIEMNSKARVGFPKVHRIESRVLSLTSNQPEQRDETIQFYRSADCSCH